MDHFRHRGGAGLSVDPEPSGCASLVIDDEGIVRLRWPAGVRITGASARAAFDAVNRLSGSVRRPMLVDMATTASARPGGAGGVP